MAQQSARASAAMVLTHISGIFRALYALRLIHWPMRNFNEILGSFQANFIY